jgi:ABC-type sugar transport system permease subunit
MDADSGRTVSVRRRPRTRISRQRTLTAYLLLLPGLIFYVPFHFLPIVGVFLLSLFDWKGYNFATMKWTGLGNYVTLMDDKFFWGALKHNFQFVIIVVVVQTVVALALALILEQKFHLSTFFRGVYFMPTVLSLVVVGILFSLILSPSQGLVNVLLRTVGLEDVQPVWLGDPAGLEAIPDELFDAAKVDGASPWDVIWRIILPLLRETTTTVIVLITVVCFKLFDLVVVMTGGGPFFATEVLSVRMYFQAFRHSRMGYGSAYGVVLFLITFAVSGLQFWLRNRGAKVEY